MNQKINYYKKIFDKFRIRKDQIVATGSDNFFDVKPIEFELAYILLPQFPIWLLLQSAVERGVPEY